MTVCPPRGYRPKRGVTTYFGTVWPPWLDLRTGSRSKAEGEGMKEKEAKCDSRVLRAFD